MEAQTVRTFLKGKAARLSRGEDGLGEFYD
jgi:hypothetical protein